MFLCCFQCRTLPENSLSQGKQFKEKGLQGEFQRNKIRQGQKKKKSFTASYTVCLRFFFSASFVRLLVRFYTKTKQASEQCRAVTPPACSFCRVILFNSPSRDKARSKKQRRKDATIGQRPRNVDRVQLARNCFSPEETNCERNKQETEPPERRAVFVTQGCRQSEVSSVFRPAFPPDDDGYHGIPSGPPSCLLPHTFSAHVHDQCVRECALSAVHCLGVPHSQPSSSERPKPGGLPCTPTCRVPLQKPT